MKTLSAAVGLIAGIVLLVPLIVAGGLLALVALPALGVARRTRPRRGIDRREPAAAVLALRPAQSEPWLDALGQRAA